MQSAIAMTPNELTIFLTAAIPAGHNVLITGAPGIGKTDIVHQVATGLQATVLLSHPAVEDPTTVAGLPWFEKGQKHASFKPFGNMALALEWDAAKNGILIWFLDDLGQASPATQAAYMQLLLAGELNGHKLPPGVVMVAATNRRTDRSGVAGLLEAVKSRFVAIVELVADLDSWCEWAYSNAIDPIMIAFLRYRDALLSAFTPTADLTNSPMPRTWANANKWLRLNLPSTIEAKAIAGAVGEAAAGEFLVFRKMYQSQVNVDAILLNPDTVALPGSPSERFAVSVALASRANAQNLKRIATYAERLLDAKHGEFSTLIFRDAIRRDETLQYTDAFVRVAAGKIGQLFNGTAN